MLSPKRDIASMPACARPKLITRLALRSLGPSHKREAWTCESSISTSCLRRALLT